MKVNDNYDPMRRWGCSALIVLWLLTAALIVFVCLSLGGCSPRMVHVPPEIRTEYKEADTAAIYERARLLFEAMFRRDVSSDSVIDRQTEKVVLKENGDTARHDRERVIYVSSRREKELEHKLSQSDSIISALRLQLESVKADSIPVPYPVVRELSRWEQTKMDFGGFALGGVAVAMCIAVVWLARKFRIKNA